MKKIYTIVVFTLAFFFFILGRLINLKVFGTDFFNAPNGERYNQLNLDIYLPILFIIIGILFRLGLFNKLFDSLDHLDTWPLSQFLLMIYLYIVSDMNIKITPVMFCFHLHVYIYMSVIHLKPITLLFFH
jgi:hypothetical protein